MASKKHAISKLRDPEYNLVGFSFVNGPHCSECNSEMTAASDSTWKCSKYGCAGHGKPVHTGVYPAWPPKE